jgi:hypothetical protein
MDAHVTRQADTRLPPKLECSTPHRIGPRTNCISHYGGVRDFVYLSTLACSFVACSVLPSPPCAGQVFDYWSFLRLPSC